MTPGTSQQFYQQEKEKEKNPGGGVGSPNWKKSTAHRGRNAVDFGIKKTHKNVKNGHIWQVLGMVKKFASPLASLINLPSPGGAQKFH